MKNQLLKLSLVLTVLLFVSCGKSDINLNTKEGIEKTKQLILENFDGDKEIYSLTINSKGDMEESLGLVYSKYLEDGVSYEQSYSLFGPKPELKNEKEKIQGYLKNAQGKVKIKDLDFDLIHKKFNEGIELIGEDYEDFVLADWYFNINNDNKVTYSMNIEATKKGEGSSVEGRNIVTNFYEFEFNIDETGKLEPNI